MEDHHNVQQVYTAEISPQNPISEAVPQVGSAGYDSGVLTDTDVGTLHRKCGTPKLSGASDYGTGSSDGSELDDRKERTGGHSRTSDIHVNTTPPDSGEGTSVVLESAHTVTCTISMAFAIPRPPSKGDDCAQNGKKKHHDKVIEAPRALGYYHLEYFLLPGDTEATKVDLVIFGVVAKLYMDHESRLLKPWHEAEWTWLFWSHSVEIRVTKDVVMKMLKHQICVRIWDSKEKVSSRARFDRPKAFRVTQGKQGEDPEAPVKQLVMNQRRQYEDTQPRPSVTLSREETGSGYPGHDLRTAESTCVAEQTDVSPNLPPIPSATCNRKPVKRSLTTDGDLHPSSDNPAWPGGRRNSLGSPSDALNMEAALQRFRHKVMSSREDRSGPVASKGRKKLQVPEKHEKMSSASSLQVERKCLTLTVSLMPLLAGDLTVTERLQETSDKILDCYVTVELNAPLLSEEQRRDLNPLVIRLLSATSLPATPTPISVLKERCAPVYCTYRFHDQPPHRTHGQTHGTHVYFKDVSVIMAGTIGPGELREYLQGPPVEIEIHDRDRKTQDPSRKPSLFGNEAEDEKLSNSGLVISRRTVHNPLTERDKSWDPYGIAKVDLCEFVFGIKYLNISVPIHNCDAPDPMSFNSHGKTAALGTVDGPSDCPLPAGHYIDAQSLLKLRVDIAVPLSSGSEASDCPYGRMVYVFDYKNRTVLQELMVQVTEINGRGLDLDINPLCRAQETLSKVGLRDDQKDDPTLDVITGIHIMDGEIHLFILEGLKDKGIRRLWESLPSRYPHCGIIHGDWAHWETMFPCASTDGPEEVES